MRVVTPGVAWCPPSDKKWDENSDLRLCMLSHKSQKNSWKNLMLEQPVNNKDCSSIQFLLMEFYQEYKKGAIRFHFPKYNFGKWNFIFQAESNFLKYKKFFRVSVSWNNIKNFPKIQEDIKTFFSEYVILFFKIKLLKSAR